MRVLMTGGGTGGHVNPAISIANAIRANAKGSEIAFVGTNRGIENRLVPNAGYDLYRINIRGLKRSLSPSNLKTAYLAVKSLIEAKKIIKNFKPDLVFGTGGYVCWPIVRMAAKLKIPTALHESNALPGVAVRMLEKYVDRVYINFEATRNKLKNPDKAIRVGNPLISDFSELNYEKSREELGIKGRYRYLLLSCGGSMGAERINNEIIEVMKNFTSKRPDVYHIHSTGSIEYAAAKRRFCDEGLDKCENIEFVEYIYDMPKKMAASDLVINRAGAVTLSELAILGKPCILIPSPNVTDNHQYKNALELKKGGAALLLEEKDLKEGCLEASVRELLEDRERLAEMKKNILKFAMKDADILIFKGLTDLIGEKSKD